MNLISYIKEENSHIGLILSETHFTDIGRYIKTKDPVLFIQNFAEYKNIF